MRVIRWLLHESIPKFLLACIASVAAGLLTLSILILLFRSFGETEAVKLQIYVALCVGAVGSVLLSRWLAGTMARNAIFLLRVELFRKIVAAPLRDIERIGRSNLIMALSDDIGRIGAAVPSLVGLCTNLVLAFAFLAYLAWLSIAQFAIIAPIVAVGLGCNLFLRGGGTAQDRISRRKRGQLLDLFRSGIDSVKELKLHATRRAQTLGAFEACARELQASGERQSWFFGGAAMVIQIVLYVSLGLVIFNYAGRVADQHLLASYAIGIVYLIGPLQGSIQTVQELRAAGIALDRIDELGLALDRAGASQSDHDADGSPTVSHAANLATDAFQLLELSGVTYSYPVESGEGERQFALGPIDLVLARGEILFVVGGNGSGKTTFAKILAGLYPPSTGSIRVNGRQVTRAKADEYCQLFSAVFDDFFVFEQFLKDQDRPTDVLRRFGMNGRVGVETGSAMQSSALSLGERKRLALMSAYLDNKPIAIFDEGAGDQDPQFKEVFYNEILRVLRDRGSLVVVISHDDRYFQVADKVLVFDRGKPSLRPVAGAANAECT